MTHCSLLNPRRTVQIEMRHFAPVNKGSSPSRSLLCSTTLSGTATTRLENKCRSLLLGISRQCRGLQNWASKGILKVRADAVSSASSGDSSSVRPEIPSSNNNTPKGGLARIVTVAVVSLAAMIGIGFAAVYSGLATPVIDAGRHFLSSSVLAKSGFFAAFSLIFASEIGDKTFFIAALLAMKFGKMISFVGSMAALSIMTVISVGIGYIVKSVPSVIESSEVFGQWLGAALLLYFGVTTLRDAWVQGDDDEDEYGEARESVEKAEKGGTIQGRTPLQAVLEVLSLIFIAEWGDRSMLATIALGAAQSPLGVAGGAILGHGIATLIAVAGGAVMSKHISERTVGFVGGTLFLVFAAATMFGLF